MSEKIRLNPGEIFYRAYSNCGSFQGMVNSQKRLHQEARIRPRTISTPARRVIVRVNVRDDVNRSGFFSEGFTTTTAAEMNRHFR
jgi:hypothetical protein